VETKALTGERGRYRLMEPVEAIQVPPTVQAVLAARIDRLVPAGAWPSSGEILRREAARFPEWFRSMVDELATISTELAGDRGAAFYGDERQELGPQELFDDEDARRAVRNVEFVAELCGRLLSEARADQ
jgi:hypothetical protein